MKTLYILYDAQCGFCSHCRRWLEQQPGFLDLRFLPRDSPEIECRFPGFVRSQYPEELVVISDEGGIYWGAHAWVMVLYALVEYREWAVRLARPALLPLARKVCELISKKRRDLSSLLGMENDATLAAEIRRNHEC